MVHAASRSIANPDDDVDDHVALTSDVIDVASLTAWATVARAGAVVSFAGVVRDHAEGRDDVTALTYEAYEAPALERLAAVVAEAREQWPAIARVALVHRLGTLALGEASVVVVVSAPHRDAAFHAARFCIDTLKETVPIWKQEHHGRGVDWGTGAMPIRAVAATSPSHRGAAE